MLKPSRTGALINVLAFILCWSGAYFPFFTYFSEVDLSFGQDSAGTWLSLVGALVLIFFMAVFASRMSLVTNLGERGFGLNGLARWCAFGVLTGTANTLILYGLSVWLGGASGGAGLLEPLANIAVVVLLYWLVFQRFPLRRAPVDESPYRPDRKIVLGWIAACVLVIAAGFVMLTTIRPAPFWPAAYVNFGLGTLNIAAAQIVNEKPARQMAALLAGFFLIGLGLLVALTGLAGS